MRYRATVVSKESGVTITTQWFPTKPKMDKFVAHMKGDRVTIHTYDTEKKYGSGLSSKFLGSY